MERADQIVRSLPFATYLEERHVFKIFVHGVSDVTNYEKYFGTPEKTSEIICYLKYPRMNHIPNSFEKSWLDWYGKKTEVMDGCEYNLLDLWTEFLKEECE